LDGLILYKYTGLTKQKKRRGKMANLIKVAKEAVEEFNKIKQNTKYSENVMLRISFGGTG